MSRHWSQTFCSFHLAPFWGFVQTPACRSCESLSQQCLLYFLNVFPHHLLYSSKWLSTKVVCNSSWQSISVYISAPVSLSTLLNGCSLYCSPRWYNKMFPLLLSKVGFQLISVLSQGFWGTFFYCLQTSGFDWIVYFFLHISWFFALLLEFSFWGIILLFAVLGLLFIWLFLNFLFFLWFLLGFTVLCHVS